MPILFGMAIFQEFDDFYKVELMQIILLKCQEKNINA